MLTNDYQLYHATGIYSFKPDKILGIGRFQCEEGNFEFSKVHVMEENGSCREADTLYRIGENDDDGDDEWLNLTGYHEWPCAMSPVHPKTWAAMKVYQAKEGFEKIVYRYMLRLEVDMVITSYLVQDHRQLARLVEELEILAQGLERA